MVILSGVDACAAVALDVGAGARCANRDGDGGCCCEQPRWGMKKTCECVNCEFGSANVGVLACRMESQSFV